MSMRSTAGAWARMGASVSNASEETSTVIFTNVLIILIQRCCSQGDLSTATAVQSQARQPLSCGSRSCVFRRGRAEIWLGLHEPIHETGRRVAQSICLGGSPAQPGHHRERVSGEAARGGHHSLDGGGRGSPC